MISFWCIYVMFDVFSFWLMILSSNWVKDETRNPKSLKPYPLSLFAPPKISVRIRFILSIFCFLLQIPVFSGAEHPLIGKAQQASNSLAGQSWQTTVDSSSVMSEHAVSAMIRLVNESPGQQRTLSLTLWFVYVYLSSYNQSWKTTADWTSVIS